MASEPDEPDLASSGDELGGVAEIPRIRGLSFLEVKEETTLSLNSSSSSSPDSEIVENSTNRNVSDMPYEHDETSFVEASKIETSAASSSMVPLEPFVHQVGGHFPMVCLATETICKPLNDREHSFYRTLPHILEPYTPKFEGVMSVAMHEDENGYITLMGTPPNCYGMKQNRSMIRSLKHHQQMLLLHHHIQQQQLKESFFGKKIPHQIRFKRTDSLEIERADSPAVSRSISVPGSVPASSTGSPKLKPDSEDSNLIDDFIAEHHKFLFYSTQEDIEEGKELKVNDENKEEIYCNPWALKCHRDHLKKLGLLSSSHSNHSGGSNSPTGCGNNATQLYLLLENLVSKYSRPCVLDLKVGSRQYADDVSAAKKQRKITKSANTTSASLGLRLCGMQVFNVNTGKYLCHNKYYGRSLTPNGFKNAIAQFLNNTDQNDQFRVDVIDQLLKKLEDLVQILQQLESFRFYTSSLLVTYDGALKPSPSLETSAPDDLVDVRIIDFAHSTHRGLKDSTLHDGPDRGFIHGIQNFIKILNELKQRIPGSNTCSDEEDTDDKDVQN